MDFFWSDSDDYEDAVWLEEDIDDDYPSRPSKRSPPLPDNVTKEWKDGTGHIHKISEMSHTHLSNTILLLEKNGNKIETSEIILVSHPCYPYLVREAIKRNLLNNPHNGVDINVPVEKTEQVSGKITTRLIKKTERKVDFDL